MLKPLRLLAIAVTVGGVAAALSACGSGGEPGGQDESSAAGGTVRSEREYRQASIRQQEQEEPQIAETQSEGAVAADGAEAESGKVGEAGDGMAVPTEIDFGHRAGLPFERNVVGDPDAPVLLVEYSDFQ